MYSNGSLFHTGIDCRVLMQKQGMHFYAAGGSPLLMASDYIIYSPCCWLGNAFIPWGIKKKRSKKWGPQVQDLRYRRESVTGYPIVLFILEYVRDAQAVLRRVVTSNTGRPVTSLTMSA